MVTRGPVLRLLMLLLPMLCFLPVAELAADPAPPPSPTADLRRHFDEVLVTARSASFRALAPARREDVIRRMNAGMLDWSEMARRALGAHWAERSASERRAFTGWFARLAERTYLSQLDHLDAAPRRDLVRFLGEQVSADEAIVQAVLASRRDVPLEFRLHRRSGRWRVIDVAVDGVSAVENYGAQFRRVIAHGSYPGLVERMLAKLEESESTTEPVVASAGR